MNEIVYALAIEVSGHFLVKLLVKIDFKSLYQKAKKNWKKLIQIFKNFIYRD